MSFASRLDMRRQVDIDRDIIDLSTWRAYTQQARVCIARVVASNEARNNPEDQNTYRRTLSRLLNTVETPRDYTMSWERVRGILDSPGYTYKQKG